jgi:hypothetical protein
LTKNPVELNRRTLPRSGLVQGSLWIAIHSGQEETVTKIYSMTGCVMRKRALIGLGWKLFNAYFPKNLENITRWFP